MALTPQLAAIKGAVAKKFADDIAAGRLVITGGVKACRPMRGRWIRKGSRKKWSEHAWENAWDLYYGDRPRKYVDAVVAWLKAEKKAGRLPVGSIITYGKRGSHVHIEGAPKRNPRPYRNVPPCAGAKKPHDPHEEEDPLMITDIQSSLNAAGFTDYQGRKLKVDGKWGKRTASAHAKMTAAAAASTNALVNHHHNVGKTGGPITGS